MVCHLGCHTEIIQCSRAEACKGTMEEEEVAEELQADEATSCELEQSEELGVEIFSTLERNQPAMEAEEAEEVFEDAVEEAEAEADAEVEADAEADAEEAEVGGIEEAEVLEDHGVVDLEEEIPELEGEVLEETAKGKEQMLVFEDFDISQPPGLLLGLLAEALSENATFPADDPRKPELGKLPVYLRIEDNYIENSIIQESIDEGTATPMKKKDKVEHSETVKCRILIRGDETEDNPYKQKEGDPPDPENAPPPKRVRDKGKGKGKGKGKTGGKGTKGTKGASRSYQYWGSSSRTKGGKGSKGHYEYHTPKPRSQYSEWQPTRRVTYKDSNEKSNKWSKDSTWGQNKQSNEKKYDKKSYDNKSYDKKSYDNKSYDNKSYDKKSYDKKSYDNKSYDNKSYDNKSYDKSNGRYDKNQPKEGWSKPKQTKDEKWNSSKWESKDSSRNSDKWGASKNWEGKDANWEKKQVAAYTDGGSQKSRQWDSKGSWKEDAWKKKSDAENGNSKSYGSNYTQSQRSAKGGTGQRTQTDGKISEAERSKRWGDKNQSWNQDSGSRGSKGSGKGQGKSKSEPFTAFRAPTRGSAAEMTRKRVESVGASDGGEAKRQKTSPGEREKMGAQGAPGYDESKVSLWKTQTWARTSTNSGFLGGRVN
eukprot:Skav217428  [mRNA]  locus=scaffold1729:122287:129597:+ [translate_table: standard]